MRRTTVLVVDDEVHITHILALKLREAGLDVLAANEPEEAYELACQFRPDLIITDYQMPQMNGFELCRRLQANPATDGIPVLLLTGRSHKISDEDLERSHVKGMVTKPFSMRDLRERIAQILRATGAAAAAAEAARPEREDERAAS
jgi:DNA-binding response OmpR family regulator